MARRDKRGHRHRENRPVTARGARHAVISVVGVVFVIGLAACGPRSPRTERDPWTQSGIDWGTPPPIASIPWRAPTITSERLRNGVRVLVVENHRMPLAGVLTIHDNAGSRADGAVHGLAALTVDSLVDGTSIEAHIASDYATHSFITTTGQLATALQQLSSSIQSPSFSEPGFMRVRERRVQELRERATRPRTIAAQAFDREVFGTHPYAWSAGGLADDVVGVRSTDARTFWQSAYSPAATTLIIVGDISVRDAVTHAAAAFERWMPPRSGRPTQLDPPLQRAFPRLAYVDMPGATESVVILGRRTAAANSRDQLAADLASSIVGGSPEAHLDRRLHRDLALTIGASASFWRGRSAGAWSAATTFRTNATLDGVRAALDVISRAGENDPVIADIALARDNLMRSNEQSFDTIAGTLRAIERLVAQDLPLDSHATLATRAATVTPEQIRAAARESMRDLSIVVVGDWSKLEVSLRELGLPMVSQTPDGARAP